MPDDSKNVYFVEPENLKMVYPCILYERGYEDTKYADNLPYAHKKRYRVTVIDEDADSGIPDKVKLLPYSAFDRHFVSDDLHHDVYNVYF